MSRPNEEEVGVCGTNLPKIHDNQHLHFANYGDISKALATMTAQAARCGCTLHELARELPCLRAVGDMLRRIGQQ